ncbi:DUF5062 family protein [Catenovulum sp. 2E275]|uniref:DUF5062 family protein n=1 Tax=Catenovulum sp. 2E275 TaxID=2980497 RepID=UPI0021D2708B|nr:DUF5062 family protein [Catenovulum sp. 2E275]MCU4677147.1 DUF5062 family protein [Catenovulum sp. 2E275]
MKKLKNESALLKKALQIGESYAQNRGYHAFSATDSAKQKIECIYRLLVQDKLIAPLPQDKEDQPGMKHRLAMWIANKLPADHPLLK